MGFLSVLSFARNLVSAKIRSGDICIDATSGNGVDTVFLASIVDARGTVYGFDVQEEALVKTRERLARQLPGRHDSVILHKISHHLMKTVIPQEHHGHIAAAMFNLGYLPGADNKLITRPETTLPALDAALELLRPEGVMTIVVYPGHDGGRQEADAVEQWSANLSQREYQVMSYRFINQHNNPPYLIAILKH